ncbi:hypothetical protein A9Q98_02650 [Thalassotalea sp. 42_200_T64]|nr:hypothetical protein A9Q98_02650 [Thalassotalea sp. 42_200_T64]
MESNPITSPEAERRELSLSNQTLWVKLNAAQKVAASSLFHYGFNLIFIRISSNDATVGLLLDGKPATINREGDIDITPVINIRK